MQIKIAGRIIPVKLEADLFDDDEIANKKSTDEKLKKQIAGLRKEKAKFKRNSPEYKRLSYEILRLSGRRSALKRANVEIGAITLTAGGKKPTKQIWKKVFRKHKTAPKKFKCATKPKRDKDRHGKQVWTSIFKYKTPDGLKAMKRIVSRDSHAPKSLMMHGRKLPFCQ